MNLPARPRDPFGGTPPRPAEDVPSKETTPADLRRAVGGAPEEPQDDRAHVLRLVGVEGKNIKDAAASIRRPYATVYGWCRSAGITPGCNKPAEATTLVMTGAPVATPTVDRLLKPETASGRWRPELTPTERAQAVQEINGAVVAAASDLGRFIDSIPEAEADDGEARPEGVDLGPPLIEVREEPTPELPAAGSSPPPLLEPATSRPEDLSITAERARALAEEVHELRNQLTVAQLKAEQAVLRAPEPPLAPRVSPAGVEVQTMEEAVQLARLLARPKEPQHIEVYVGPPREARVERLEQGIRAVFRVLRGSCGTDHERLQLADRLLTDTITGGAS